MLLAGCIRLFNATLDEIDRLDAYEEELCLLTDLESQLLLTYQGSEHQSLFNREQIVLSILTSCGHIDYRQHVLPWLQVY